MLRWCILDGLETEQEVVAKPAAETVGPVKVEHAVLDVPAQRQPESGIEPELA